MLFIFLIKDFYLGEHGWVYKRFMYEESFSITHVNVLSRESKKGSNPIEQMVMNIDIGPTLLEAAGLKVPSSMQGSSFLPIVEKPNVKGRAALYYHYYENGEHSVSPHFGIKTARFKL